MAPTQRATMNAHVRPSPWGGDEAGATVSADGRTITIDDGERRIVLDSKECPARSASASCA